MKFRDFFKERINIIVFVLIILGCLIRIIGIDKLPIGLNCDEASSGYEAYSILNYGIDRNGNFLPVFLEAWGSGQNALYSYLMIPFVKLFGLNIITTRLPMAIIGCISLVVWYMLLKKIREDNKFSIIGLLFIIICPWHIMKSRWGLESNVFPDLILWSVFFLINYLKEGKKYNIYISSFIMGITGYAYGTAYFFLPIFFILLFGYLLFKKYIRIKDTIICFGIIGIITLPIMIYVIINTFDLPQINLPFMTIPRLPINRYEEQTTIFSGNVILNSFENIKNSILLLIVQNDKLAWNCIPGFGMYYIVSIPVLIIGLIFSFKKTKLKSEYDNIINIWFISAFLLLFVFKEANINRINILIFPLIYYIVKGIYLIIDMKKIYLNIAILLIYLVNFLIFVHYYINMDIKDYWTFTNNVQEVIEYVENQDADKIYFEYAFKEPYIYVLYYGKYNTHDFVDTVDYFNEKGVFENVKSFGKYYFYLPEEFNEEKCLYVLKKNDDLQLNYSKFNIKEFKEYLVLEVR